MRLRLASMVVVAALGFGAAGVAQARPFAARPATAMCSAGYLGDAAVGSQLPARRRILQGRQQGVPQVRLRLPEERPPAEAPLGVSLTSSLFKAARLSATMRAAAREPKPFGKRMARIMIGRAYARTGIPRWPR